MKVCAVLISVFVTVYCADRRLAYKTVKLVNNSLISNNADCGCELFDELYQGNWMHWLPSTLENVHKDFNDVGVNETAPGAATLTDCPSGKILVGSKCITTH